MRRIGLRQWILRISRWVNEGLLLGLHPSLRSYHTDINGAPEELTSHQGRVVWRARYRTWGNTVMEEWDEDYRHYENTLLESRSQNLRFQGQYLDRESGLHYNTFRYYDPDIGRFISQDPIGLMGGINLYQYAPNPTGWIDPWGWCAQQNQTQGNAGRDALLARLMNSKRFTVIDREVRINTPQYGNYRRSDIVIRDNKTGKFHQVEVKTGNASRDASQIARDHEIASGQNTTWGSRRIETDQYGVPTGIKKGAPTGPVPTIEVTVDPTTGKILK